MGRMVEILTAQASLSNHNSEQDDRDWEAWQSFARRVRALAREPEYADINIDVTSSVDDEG